MLNSHLKERSKSHAFCRLFILHESPREHAKSVHPSNVVLPFQECFFPQLFPLSTDPPSHERQVDFSSSLPRCISSLFQTEGPCCVKEILKMSPHGEVVTVEKYLFFKQLSTTAAIILWVAMQLRGKINLI